MKLFIEEYPKQTIHKTDESLKEDYINIDGVYYDDYEIYRRYHDLIRSDKVNKLHGIYYDVGGNEDDFIIDAIDSGFSKLDIAAFLMFAVEDSLSLKEIKGLFKSLNISLNDSVRRSRKPTIDEGVAASLLTIKNQLMNKLGSAFKAIGGSMNPKVTVYREDDPDTSFDITTDGKNVDIVPKYDGIPDTVHKKRGIAFMRAVNVLYDFIMDTLGGNGKLATENVRVHKRRKRRK